MHSGSVLTRLALGALATMQATASAPLLWAPLDASEWGLDRWSDVRRGQVRVVHDERADRLSVSWLDGRPPSAAAVPTRGGAWAPEPADNCAVLAQLATADGSAAIAGARAFSREPSSAAVAYSDPGDGRGGLAFDYRLRDVGWAGVSLRLWRAPSPASINPLDARGFSTLSFWIRGRQGGEDLQLKVADVRWNQIEDSLPVGEVGEFLADRAVSANWQRAVVPLSSLPSGIDPGELMELIVAPAVPGAGTVYLRDLALCRDPEPLPGLPEATAPPGPLPSFERAVWFWNTADVLDDPAAQEELVSYVHQGGFAHVYMQLTSGRAGAVAGGVEGAGSQGPGIAIDTAPMRALLGKLGRRGIKVHALDGDASYALPENHDFVLGSLRNVVAYNREVDETERFVGIHYDIEPYLLPGYGGTKTEQYLQAYLRLHAAMAEIAGEAGLVFGVDIPFWYDGVDEYTGEPVTLTFRGRRKPLYQHILDMVDNVGIMDYRTFADGTDGTIAHARGELEYAERSGTDVFVALETGRLNDESLFRFEGAPQRGVPEDPDVPFYVLLDPAVDEPGIFLVPGTELERFGTVLDERGIAGDRLLAWGAGRRIRVPASKLSFADLGAGKLDEIIEQTVRALSGYTSFRGIAIHHYGSLRELR